RHTRFSRDWSSDVCSSDLTVETGFVSDPCVSDDVRTGNEPCGVNGRGSIQERCVDGQWVDDVCNDADVCADGESRLGSTECGGRSEERRVGNGWSARWTAK